MTMRFGDLSGRGPLGLKGAKPIRGTAEARRHIERIKALPCVICHRPGPSDAHHVFCGRYGQRKASDFEVIPLCRMCHQEGPFSIHQNKRLWVETNGPDHEYLPVVADMLAGELTPIKGKLK
jgi:hypothetical protein